MKSKSSKSFRFPILFFLRLFTGLVFFYSGWTKVIEPVESFRAVILGYDVLPYQFAGLIAHVFPWVELMAGAFLLVGYMTRFSALLTGILSAAFIALVGAYFFKNGIFPADCGCFGEGSIVHLTGKQVMLLDFVNVMISVSLFIQKTHQFCLDALWTSPQE